MATMRVHADFQRIGDTKWDYHSWDTTGEVLGSHEVLIVGYNDKTGRFLAQNSWGPRWADGGFFGIPYDMIGKIVYEFWILSKIKVPYIPVLKDSIHNVIEPEESDGRTIWIGIILAVIGIVAMFIFG
jgi:hypothetical protein